MFKSIYDVPIGSLIRVYMNMNNIPVHHFSHACCSSSGFLKQHLAVLMSHKKKVIYLGFDNTLTSLNDLSAIELSSYAYSNIKKFGLTLKDFSQEALDRASFYWCWNLTHSNDAVSVELVMEASDGKLPTSGVITTPQPSNIIAVDNGDDPSIHWRAWQHSRPGECPCGINRKDCSYHR